MVIGYSAEDWEPRVRQPDGSYKIFKDGVYDHISLDYHWYRQNQDGTWSHKPGLTEVQNTDGNGMTIVDPRTAYRGQDDPVSIRGDKPISSLHIGPSYDYFYGYFEVGPKNNGR